MLIEEIVMKTGRRESSCYELALPGKVSHGINASNKFDRVLQIILSLGREVNDE
jgi:hypothetical protein